MPVDQLMPVCCFLQEPAPPRSAGMWRLPCLSCAVFCRCDLFAGFCTQKRICAIRDHGQYGYDVTHRFHRKARTSRTGKTGTQIREACCSRTKARKTRGSGIQTGAAGAKARKAAKFRNPNQCRLRRNQRKYRSRSLSRLCRNRNRKNRRMSYRFPMKSRK